MKKRAYVEVRSQHIVGVWPKVGPDKYVAVQVVPDGVKRLSVLNRKIAKKRGIDIIYCGEGYSNRNISPRSMFNVALEKARSLADKINNK